MEGKVDDALVLIVTVSSPVLPLSLDTLVMCGFSVYIDAMLEKMYF